MNTPVCDFVKKYAEERACRFHMPGHKGKGALKVEAFDITEIDGADSLFEADGIIAESEKNASNIFGSDTYYSAEGSSLCIRAMMYLCRMYAVSCGKAPFILAGRNAHKTLVSAAALLDMDIRWIYPEDGCSYLSCDIDAKRLEGILEGMNEKPSAVYITSPDYLGNTVDVKEIADVCHRYGILLAVDNAHGAYLKFFDPSCHPMDLGADICCDSAHKTLPALTGAAYLHLSDSAPDIMRRNVKRAMEMFASTSPSYLILQSLDSLNPYLEREYRVKLGEAVKRCTKIKENLSKRGMCVIGDEPMKITLDASAIGYDGNKLSEELNKKSIVCEFHDRDYIVFMPSASTNEEEFSRLEAALMSIPVRERKYERKLGFCKPERVMSIRQAALSPSEVLPVDECEGRILSTVNIGCPPAVPIIVCGERFDNKTIEILKYYGIKESSVVLE